MKIRYFSFLLCLLAADNAWAVNTVSGSAYSAWMNGVPTQVYGNVSGAGDFILAGSIGKGGGHGTYDDEYAIVGVVAMQIVEHGGYFCPQQIQCANTNCNRRSWSLYFNPTGYSADKCVWLCEKGYSGTNCSKLVNVVAGSTVETNKSGLFGGLDLKTSGGEDDGTEHANYAFSTWFDKSTEYSQERDVLLGAVEFKAHGIVAGPVSINCKADSKCGNNSFVSDVSRYSNANYKLLCAEGYIPDSTNSECIPLTQQMFDLMVAMGDKKSMCSGWSQDAYNGEIHRLDTEGDCVKFFCKDSTKAFPASGNFECEDCARDIRGGQDPKNGQCVVCDRVGQYFNTDTSACANADAYKKSDLQYGKGKTKDSDADVDNQCWTKVTIEEYAPCVKGESVSTTDASSSTSSSSSGISGSKVIAPQDMLDTTLRK